LYAGHFDWDKPLLWTVPDILSPIECQSLIKQSEEAQWLAATVNSVGGRVVDASIRDNDTAIIHNDALAESIYSRLLRHVPTQMSREENGKRVAVDVCGLYTPMRVYRYKTGQHFGLHRDQSYTRAEDGARSFLTVIIYLNDDFSGGETEFPQQQQKISPKQGAVLLFQHMLLHAGLHITQGVKYLLRTDVMYTSKQSP
jgi:prolyl 4-hydroxylase